MPNCFGLIFVMWCSVATPPPKPVTPDLKFCDGYKQPVLLSHADTRGTKEQVDERNRIFKTFCMKAVPK